MLFDGLTVLQHRGQDAAGIVTSERGRLHLRKDNGLVKDVFQQHHMTELRGNVGIGHCRYPTAGTSSCAEAQPLYTNFPHGICVAHNGNLTNAEELTNYMTEELGRHVNTDSDSELLLNLFADALTKDTVAFNKEHTPESKKKLEDAVFKAVSAVMKHCKGGFAGMFLINGIGLVGFRDPNGIRPLVFGCRRSRAQQQQKMVVDTFDEEGVPQTPHAMEEAGKSFDYVISSESVAIDTLGFQLVRYVPKQTIGW